jgi:hypothetical protein
MKVRSKTVREAAAPQEIEHLARKHADAAVAALAAVMKDETATAAARISAASTLLQWGFGRTAAAVKGKAADNGEQIIRLTWGEA